MLWGETQSIGGDTNTIAWPKTSINCYVPVFDGSLLNSLK